MQGGYDKSRFINLQGEIFDCPICSKVVKFPKECNACGNLFCTDCIDFYKRNHSACKFGCIGNTIHPMTARALINIYEELDIKCSKCNKSLKLGKLNDHQGLCGRTKCIYQQLCDGFQDKSIKCEKPVCSERCQFLHKIKSTGGDQKQMYDLLIKYKPKPILQGANFNLNQGSSRNLDLIWRPVQCGANVQFNNGGKALYLKEQAYIFRSVITTEGFTSGAHYWEIHADNRTENELKIGVCTQDVFDFNTAFCDHKFGFAFYGLGQLRHGSNASGSNFGKRFKKSGILGVYLNMNNGTLHISLNGEYLGKAFQDSLLTKGPIYPAVGLLHCAGCSIHGQLPIPSLFKSL